MEFVENKGALAPLRVLDTEQKINGVFKSAVEFIEENQLLDTALWVKFVNQYREQPDAPTLAWRGEYWGKMMRGATSVYAHTKNERLYNTLEATVRDMLTVAEEDGRVSTYEREKEFQGWDLWCRKYVLLGMLYFYDICKSDALKCEIIDFSTRHADYIINHIGKDKLDITKASSSWFGINSSSLLEPIVWLYKKTGQERYLRFADYIVERGGADRFNVFELAYENKLLPYQYGVSKAYELISCFEGLVAYCEVRKNEKYKTAATNFGYAILDSEVSIIGTLGCTHELLDHTTNRQTADIGGIKQETCVTVTWMKYCATLYRLTGDRRFADAIEQSFYNAYLGAINTERNESAWVNTEACEPKRTKASFMPFDSYSPLTPGKRGIGIGGYQVLSDGSYYGCCACIGSVGLGIYASHRVLGTEGGIALSFFEDGVSEVNIENGHVKITTEGNYPRSADIKIKIEVDTPLTFDFKVRIPAWSKNHVIKSDRAFRIEDGFAVFFGEWIGTAVIDITFDMTLREIYPVKWDEDVVYTDMTGSADGWHFANAATIHHKPTDDDYIALMRGPIVLAADSRFGKSADSAFEFRRDNGALVYNEVSGESTLALEFLAEDGERFTLIDYASAGKDWKTLVAAWLPRI